MQVTRTPLISTIITTHNRSSLVVRAIESVLQQTFRDFELIVVDDAGTDNTGELLQNRYGGAITYIRQEQNKGVSAARNAGIKHSRGTYIAFLDDDDEWLPEKLARQIERMQQDPAPGMVYCWSYMIDEHDTVIRLLQHNGQGTAFNDLLSRNIDAPPSAVLVRKSVLTAAGVFDIKLSGCADWDLWLRIAKESSIAVLPAALVKYRIHGQNMHSRIAIMEQDTFMILRKYEADINHERYKKLFIDKSVYFAWEHYAAGNKDDFSRLLSQALQAAPLQENMFNCEGDIREKERDFFAVLDAFWSSQGAGGRKQGKKQAFARLFRQLAWGYYHRGDLKEFRRCVRNVCFYSWPRIPVRLLIAYMKSLPGRSASEKIHELRKQILKG